MCPLSQISIGVSCCHEYTLACNQQLVNTDTAHEYSCTREMHYVLRTYIQVVMSYLGALDASASHTCSKLIPQKSRTTMAQNRRS